MSGLPTATNTDPMYLVAPKANFITDVTPTESGGPQVIALGPAEWDAYVAGLQESRRANYNPTDIDYTHCGREIPTASNGAEVFPDAFYRLKEAAIRGDLTLVKTIYEEDWLAYTATGRFSNDDLYSVMSATLDEGRTTVVAFLLSQDVRWHKELDPYIAVEKGMDSLLPIYLERGWDINKPLSPLVTSLIVRVLDNRPLCEWFLSQGADPNVQCTRGSTPMTAAIVTASRDIIDLLFEHGGSIEHGQLIHAATRRSLPDYLEVFQMLLDKGCDINEIQFHDNKISSEVWGFYMGLGSPLHSAAEKGRTDLVKFLLDRGADAKLRDTWGFLPIDKAKDKNHTEVINLLKPYTYPRPELTAAL